MTTKSQNERILAALRRGPLTPMQALQRFGCFRLAARIWEIKERGWLPDPEDDIRTEYVTTKSGARVARYRLVRV